MSLEGSEPQIPKLGLATKMGLASQFLLFFQPKSTNIDDKLDNDPFQINNDIIFLGIDLTFFF
jgi:hypothetical protein